MEELLDIALSYGVRIQFIAIFSSMSKVRNVITVIFNGLWLELCLKVNLESLK